MKSKNVILMVVAVGCGLVAAVLTARLSGSSGPDMVDVWVAKKELPVGTILEEKELENLLMQTKMPRASVPQDIVNTLDELKGKRVNRTLKPNNYFATTDVGPDDGIKIPGGKFKAAIRCDAVKGGGGFVQPGNKVDIILTEALPNGKAKSGVILYNMLVLAVDTNTRPAEGSAQGRAQMSSVALAVDHQEAQTLKNAEKRGEVTLIIRGDKNDPDDKKTSPSTLIKGYDTEETVAPVAPAPPKTVAVLVARVDVPMNTYITGDNWESFFTTKQIAEELVNTKTIKDPASVRGKFIVKALEADQLLFNTMIGDDKIEIKPEVVEKPAEPDPLEILPQPRELVVEPPLYPRKFEQIINNQRVWFLETAPGEFRRVDSTGPDLKDIPTTSGASTEKKPQPKKIEPNNDRAA